MSFIKKEYLNIPDFLYHKLPLILGSVFVMFMGTLANLGYAWVLKIIIDEAIPKKQMDILLGAIVALVLLPVLSALLASAGNKISNDIGGQITDFLSKQMFDKLTRISPVTINEFNLGDLVGRLTRSCGLVGTVFVEGVLLPIVSNVFMFIGILGFMLYLSWQLTVISLILIPFIIIAAKKLGAITLQKTNQIVQIVSRADTYFTEVISGMKTVQAYGQEQRERDYMGQWLEDIRKMRIKRNMVYVWFASILNRFAESFGVGLVFTFGAWQVLHDQLSVGSLVMFVVYIPQLYTNMQSIPKAYLGYKDIKPTIEQIVEIFQLPEKITDVPEAIALQEIKEGIQFQNVSFSYSNSRGEVRNISFEVKQGEMLGIVGPTGGGKSTLLDLLMRFYDPSEGEIVIDGKNIREYRLKDLRKQIGVVSQDVFLWSSSIRDNLSYVNPAATAEQIDQAAKIAQIYDFIENLPDGYDTIVGDRGIKLSGGERQRLAIARTILRDPQVILLDEPTSALDAVTESLLQKQLEKLFEGKTVIVVAHRLATIRRANRIIVVDNGRIAENGTHAELMKRHGIYSKMYSNQLGISEIG